jgi:hypothetical protein
MGLQSNAHRDGLGGLGARAVVRSSTVREVRHDGLAPRTQRMGACRQARWCVVLAAAALFVPPSANAHIRSATVATDYRTRVFALPAPFRRVISARIYQSDRAIRLTVVQATLRSSSDISTSHSSASQLQALR